MKECGCCGMHYPDDYTVCPFDDRPLLAGSPAKPPGSIRRTLANLAALRDDPSTVRSFLPRRPVQEYFELLFRYLMATLVIISVFFALALVGLGLVTIGLSIPSSLPSDDSIVIGLGFFCALGGCIGAFLGTLTLPQGRRAFGSSAFLLMAITYWCSITLNGLASTDGISRDLSLIGCFVIGAAVVGIVPVVLFFNWGRWPKFPRRHRP